MIKIRTTKTEEVASIITFLKLYEIQEMCSFYKKKKNLVRYSTDLVRQHILIAKPYHSVSLGIYCLAPCYTLMEI